MDKDLVKKVKSQIDEILKDCEETGIYPTICKLKRDRNGLEKVYRMVINLVVNEDLGIEESIAQIESAWEI